MNEVLVMALLDGPAALSVIVGDASLDVLALLWLATWTIEP